jgi:hypothetical protein
MSHFSKIKTNFKSLELLKSSILELPIQGLLNISIDDTNIKKIEITQENDKTIVFQWTCQEYELVTDLYFWQQSMSVENFLNTLTQQYAHNVIVSEGLHQGFESVDKVHSKDGSVHLVLQRWA